MADKIVILEDENGNNIYPITRGLAANSVDTNAIQDGAVTSSKIDSATYPSCFAYKSAVASVAAGDIVTVNVFQDNVGGFTIGPNGGVVVPKTGKYIISAGVGGSFSAGTGWVRINQVGGSTIATAIDRSNASAVYKSLSIGGFAVSLTAGAEIYLRAVDAIYSAGDGGLEKSNFIGLAMIP